MTITKPMLAGVVKDASKLKYPLIASPKFDGIRCLVLQGQALSRSFKPIPNDHINRALSYWLPDGCDGEIMSGPTFQATTSAVMRKTGAPAFQYYMFDFVVDGQLDMPYYERMIRMIEWYDENPAIRHYVTLVPGEFIHGPEQLLLYEAKMLELGYEGVMTRDPKGPYKCGRSTEKQQYLLKLKRFVDDEAEIIGFEEMMHNDNPAEVDELGHTKRSSSKAGKTPAGTLGKFNVRCPKTGLEFNIGTGQGLTQDLRQRIWNNRENYMGMLVKYRYQAIGVKEAPRCPVWLGFRHPDDTSNGDE